jgi:superfamily II DNA/RNA helicase
VYNVLVATSIGEEGLDIGDVDLIISYDASASPVRMLQRSGRTGRKREGHVVFLVTEGKEQRDHAKSLDAYNVIQKKIASGKDFNFKEDESPRILPPEITPDVVKMEIRAPDEDKGALELQVERKRRGTKRKERDWSLPDDVEAGFVSARELARRGENGPTRKTKAKKREALGTPSPGRRLSSRNPNISPSSAGSPDAISRVYDELPSSSESELGDLSTELAAFAERRKMSKGKQAKKQEVVKAEVVKAEVVDPFEMDLPPSSVSEIGDLMTELQKARKGREVILVDSDEDEYGLPSEFERTPRTPRKRIRIEDFSDEE